MTTILFSLILTLFAIVSNAAFLRYEDGPLETVPRFRRCLSCEDERWRPPPNFYHYHHGPHFHSHQWSGMSRSPDGYQQQVFSGAAASADSDTQNSGGSQAFSLASSSAGSDDQYRNTGYKHSQNQGSYSNLGYGNKESFLLPQASGGNQGIDKHDVENQQQHKQVGLKQTDYIGHGSGAGFGGNVDGSSSIAALQPDFGTQQQQQQFNHGSSGVGFGNKENGPSQTLGSQGFDKQDAENQQQQKQFGFKQSDYINHGSGAGFGSNIDISSASSGTQSISKPDFGTQQQQQQFNHGSSGVGFGNKENSGSHTFGTQGFDKEDVGNQQQQKQFGFKRSDYINHGSGAGFGGNSDSSIASSHDSSGSQTINKPDFAIQQQQQPFNYGSYSGAGYGNKENVPSQNFGTHGFDKQNLGTQQQFGLNHSQNSNAGYNNGGNSASSSQTSSGTQSLRKNNLDNQQQQQQIEGPNSKDSWETIQHQNQGNMHTGSNSNNANLQSQTPNTNGLQVSRKTQQQLSLGGNVHNKDFSGSYSNSGRGDKHTNNLQSTEGHGYGWFVGPQSGNTESKLNNGKSLENEHFGQNQDKTVDSSVADSEQRPTSIDSGSFQSTHNQNLNKNYNTGSLANHEALNDQQIQQHGAESFGKNQFQSNGHSYEKTKSSLSGALSLASQGLQASDNSNTDCSTCSGKESIAYSNAKSHSGSAIALSVGGK